jgi:FtsZ-binding cell division protein ZapB
MDDLGKKLFAQFDDPMPAQRCNALEALREHLLKQAPPQTFRDVLHEFESAVPKQKVEALEKELGDFKTANAQAKQANDALTQENDRLRREVATWKTAARGAVAIRMHWKKLAAGVAVLALLGGAYYWWGPGAAAAVERQRVNAAYRAALEKITWQEGQSGPVVGMVTGKPYWIMVRGEIETSHVDNAGRPVTLQCSHVFGVPATADWSGAYQPPELYNALGWLRWPERATVCKVAPASKSLASAETLIPGLVSDADAAPAKPEPAGDSETDRVMRTLTEKNRDYVHRRLTSEWHPGSGPKAAQLIDWEGAKYWTLVRYDEDPQKGRCARLFAVRAEYDGNQVKKQEPYTRDGQPAWPERVTTCQPPYNDEDYFHLHR